MTKNESGNESGSDDVEIGSGDGAETLSGIVAEVIMLDGAARADAQTRLVTARGLEKRKQGACGRGESVAGHSTAAAFRGAWVVA